MRSNSERTSSRGDRIARMILRFIVSLLLLAWLVVQVYPIVFLFATSLKADPEILSAPFALPFPPKFSNYAAVIEGGRTNQSILVYFANSVIITGGTLVLLIGAASLAGYALARGTFPGSAATQQLFLLALAVPVHVLLIPIYFFFGQLGLRNSLLGMILLYATLGLPFTIILMRSYFLSFPRTLEDAARIDGCNRFQVFWRIVLPISRGAMASMAIINIGWVWSELFFGLTLLDRAGVRTLPLAIAAYKPASMAQQTAVGELFAIMSLTVLPMLIVYFLFQKQIRKGMTAGAINPHAMSYGYDRLRFIKPVFLNDTIRARATISEKRDHPKKADHGVVVETLEVTNQRGETVLVADHLLLVKRKPAAGAAS